MFPQKKDQNRNCNKPIKLPPGIWTIWTTSNSAESATPPTTQVNIQNGVSLILIISLILAQLTVVASKHTYRPRYICICNNMPHYLQ